MVVYFAPHHSLLFFMKYSVITFFFLSLSMAGISQQKDSVTKADYARAEQMLSFISELNFLFYSGKNQMA